MLKKLVIRESYTQTLGANVRPYILRFTSSVLLSVPQTLLIGTVFDFLGVPNLGLHLPL